MVRERAAAGRTHEDALRRRDGSGNVAAGTKECCVGEDVFKDLHVLVHEPHGLRDGFCADAVGIGGRIDHSLKRREGNGDAVGEFVGWPKRRKLPGELENVTAEVQIW